MIGLTLLWLAAGAALGILGYAAALVPTTWRLHSWRVVGALVATGALAGGVGGWTGALLLGRVFGSPSAVWVAILAIALLPRLVIILQQRTRQTPADSRGA